MKKSRKKYSKSPKRKACAGRYIASGKASRAMYKNHLERKYKISIDDYDRMFEAQGGRCAICNNVQTHTYKGSVTRLAVDHDHKTGKVRGLLCHECNAGIGFLHEDKTLLRKAVTYLDTYGVKNG